MIRKSGWKNRTKVDLGTLALHSAESSRVAAGVETPAIEACDLFSEDWTKIGIVSRNGANDLKKQNRLEPWFGSKHTVCQS